MRVNNEGGSVLAYPKYSGSYAARFPSLIPTFWSFFHSQNGKEKWEKKEERKTPIGVRDPFWKFELISLTGNAELSVDTRTTTCIRSHTQPAKYTHRRTHTYTSTRVHTNALHTPTRKYSYRTRTQFSYLHETLTTCFVFTRKVFHCVQLLDGVRVARKHVPHAHTRVHVRFGTWRWGRKGEVENVWVASSTEFSVALETHIMSYPSPLCSVFSRWFSHLLFLLFFRSLFSSVSLSCSALFSLCVFFNATLNLLNIPSAFQKPHDGTLDGTLVRVCYSSTLLIIFFALTFPSKLFSFLFLYRSLLSIIFLHF